MENPHFKSRQTPYSGTKDVERTKVPDEKVSWDVEWPEYNPTEYTSPIVLKNPPWADDENPKTIKNFHQIDENIDRRSFMGKYQIDKETNRPKNPKGRTGLCGRGLLGRWGPNHAGDPIVTRWANKEKKILEIILVTRKDTGELALPGGMVDAGEHISATIKREFIEEAVNSNADAVKDVDRLFKTAVSIYQGYIDDPRNTDNSWMETEAMNMHDETGELTKDLKLEAGDDASKVKWIRLDRPRKFYASHENLIRTVVEKHDAFHYWNEQ